MNIQSPTRIDICLQTKIVVGRSSDYATLQKWYEGLGFLEFLTKYQRHQFPDEKFGRPDPYWNPLMDYITVSLKPVEVADTKELYDTVQTYLQSNWMLAGCSTDALMKEIEAYLSTDGD